MKLKTHQTEGVKFLVKHKKALLADDMGLGKTAQAIGLINALNIRSTVIVAPASLIDNWKNELEIWLEQDLSVNELGANGFIPERTNVLLCTYDKYAKYNVSQRTKPQLLIFDEAHLLKTPNSRRTLSLKHVRAERIVCMTGTPILNRPIELFPIIWLLDKQGLGKDVKRYAQRYCDAHWDWNGRLDMTGASNLKELRSIMKKRFMLQRSKKDTDIKLERKHRQIIDLRTQKEITKSESKQNAAKFAQMANLQFAEPKDVLSIVRHEHAMEKMPLVKKYINTALEQHDKIVVFSHHRDVLETLRARHKDYSTFIIGGQSSKDKQNAADRFNQDPDVRILFGSTMATGLGFNLTASNIVIFAELDWSFERLKQAEDRCWRIGQTKEVFVKYLVLPNTVDHFLAYVLSSKVKTSEEFYD